MILQGHNTPSHQPGTGGSSNPSPKPSAHKPTHHPGKGGQSPAKPKPSANKPSAHKPAHHKPSHGKKTAPRWKIEVEEFPIFPLPGLKQSGHIH